MEDLKEFIIELQKKDSKIASHFTNKQDLINSLEELDDVIGMRKIKSQIVKQIKTFVSAKVKGFYKEKDRKHCLLCGPPGCGKTTVAKILCKIWIAMGFLSGTGGNKKVNSFNKLQDEIIRKQKTEIKEYKDKLRLCTKVVMNLGRVSTVCKRSLSNIVSIKDSVPQNTYRELFNDLTGSNNIIEDSNKLVTELNTVKAQAFNGMEVEIDKEMEKTQDDVDLPFYVYNRNDVVSRYVGDTSHRCTKAMNDALGGVAYFDEAYNLCNDTHGLGDSYGRVALTIINQYMDTFSDRLIVVFSGYKEDIYNGLFKAQRGLESRFTNKFDIEAYTPDEMTQIFIQRLNFSGWRMVKTPELVNLIKENFSIFKYYGRDMDTLAMYTKNVMSERVYNDIVGGDDFPTIITDIDPVKKAVEIFKDNIISHTDTKSEFEKFAEALRA
jgi:energy-coupling factor transporter ATP-binding protein EcfA2